ncbi:MAG: phage holin family protein [Acidobacteria bacterium]|nr:phage holin family protein [Acidobacteriota bacterium]
MRQEAPKEREVEVGREKLGDLLARLASASAGLVRDEIDLAKQEVREKVQSLRTGSIILAIGVLFAIIAILTLTAALVIGIGNAIGYGWASLAVGIAAAIIGGILALIGLSKLKKTNLKPVQTINSLKEDREWLKRMT